MKIYDIEGNVVYDDPLMQEKEATENGEVLPDEGFDGLSKVNVNVATGSEVVEPLLQSKTITMNGTFTADEGYDGLSEVTVRVDKEGWLDGLSNGFDVMFNDEFGNALAFYCIKQGHAIEPPVYDCRIWQKADGSVVMFPLVPDGDMELFCNNESYQTVLYDYYGIDRVLFPYLIIKVDSVYINVVFAKTLKNNLLGTESRYNYKQMQVESYDMNYLVNVVLKEFPTLKTAGATYGTALTDTEECYYCMNFDYDFTKATVIGRLDE